MGAQIRNFLWFHKAQIRGFLWFIYHCNLQEKRLSGVSNYFMSCAAGALKQHPYPACFVLGCAVTEQKVSREYNQIFNCLVLQNILIPIWSLLAKGVRGTCLLDPFPQKPDAASLVLGLMATTPSEEMPCLFSCHHIPRGTNNSRSHHHKHKAFFCSYGNVWWLYNSLLKQEAIVTVGVAWRFRLGSSCLFLKEELQNKSFGFSLLHLLKHLLLKSIYNVFCFSGSQAPR